MKQRDHDPMEAQGDERIEAAYRRGAHQCLAMALDAAMEKSTLEERLAFLCHLSNIITEMRFARRTFPGFLHEALARASKQKRGRQP